MATWIECQAYVEGRTKFWVNLDHVAFITGHDNGSVLTMAMADGEGAVERVVWDKPAEIFAKAKK